MSNINNPVVKRFLYPPITPHRNIYGQYIAQLPIGFCHNQSHRGSLTTQLYKKHNCAKKNCPFFKKNPDHPHWKRKAKLKTVRKPAQ